MHIDRLGRIVIPTTFRRALDLNEKTALEVCLDGDKVIVRRSSSCCKLCYANIDSSSDPCLCPSCIEKIKKL
ncbi:MAG: AbrB family transcriptional regulator [Ruminococcaceae bacterium]|nr:AbrB family transcriptional regulator [Oscillospiraceae bacterium]